MACRFPGDAGRSADARNGLHPNAPQEWAGWTKWVKWA